MRYPLALTLLALLAMQFVVPAMAGAQIPSVPHYFYGTLQIDGADAPAGTTVEARVAGALTGSFNPIVTTEAGKYGDVDPAANVPRLLVQGDVLEGATIEFFVNGVKANETAAWHSGQITELNLTAGAPPPPVITAEIALSQGLDSGGAYLAGSIVRLFDANNGATLSLAEGIGAYDVFVGYDAAGVSAKTAAGVAPFSSATVVLNTAGGAQTTIVSSQSGSDPQPPLELFRLYPWLTGSRATAYDFTLHFNSLTQAGGGAVQLQGDVSRTFWRGDANGDGAVTIVDALFVAQYLAGTRTLGEGAGQLRALNAATPKNDSTSGSTISIVDALFIAQMLAGIRTPDYSFTP